MLFQKHFQSSFKCVESTEELSVDIFKHRVAGMIGIPRFDDRVSGLDIVGNILAEECRNLALENDPYAANADACERCAMELLATSN